VSGASDSPELSPCPPLHVAATFSEKNISLSWDSCSSAHAYNVYADWGKGFERANFKPITSGTRFVFFRTSDTSRFERAVKGHSVTLYAVPVYDSSIEGEKGSIVTTSYFKGFETVLSQEKCKRIIKTADPEYRKLLPKGQSITADKFIRAYVRLAIRVHDIYKNKIDPSNAGACVPFSTVAAKYFTAKGIPCYRAQGSFIAEFHSFNLVIVDTKEYILDFTSDQFIPNTAPVLIPLSHCFIDSTGQPVNNPRGTFTVMYRINQIYDPKHLNFTKTKDAQWYQEMLDSLLRE